MRRLMMAGALAALTVPVVAADRVPAGLSVDRTVLLMRHGVRPPTKAPAMPAEVTPKAWPDWPTRPGWLTPHGAVAVSRLGSWDGARFRGLGLLPRTGCPAPGTIRVIADSDQRTIATADAWAAAVAPSCGIASRHRPQDETDPIFSPLGEGSSLDPAQADKAVAEAVGAGGIAAIEARYRPLLGRLDGVLCGTATAGCGVRQEATTLIGSKQGKRPRLDGALDRASTAAQILLLEYADGKPMSQVGWGRANAGDIAAFSAFHALEFRLLARPPYVAEANLAGIMPLIREGLTGPARITMLSGHDTNVANLAGLLDLHWSVPGFAADDPSPGGAIILERLHDRHGGLYVRALYRSQTLAQIRAAAPLAGDPPHQVVMPISGCAALGVKGLCTLAAFERKLGGPPRG